MFQSKKLSSPEIFLKNLDILFLNCFKFIMKYPHSHSYHMLHVIMMMNDNSRKFMMTVFV